jgi:hypothetical protein
MATDNDVKQALGQVARLGAFAIKRIATTDDLKDHVISITITRPSNGWHQEHLQFEEEDLIANVDGTNGHVDSLQVGDRAETGAEADAEIAAAAAGQGPEWDKDKTAEQLAAGSTTVRSSTTGPDVTTGTVDTTPIEQTDAKPDIHLVGEAAALGKKRR